MIYRMLTGQELLENMLRQVALKREPDATDKRLEFMVDRFFAKDPSARKALCSFFQNEVLRQAQTGDIRDSVSHEFQRESGQTPRRVVSSSIDSDALDLICSALTVAEKRPTIRELMTHKFFQVSYPEIPRNDPERNRSKVLQVLQGMNAGDARTDTAKAMKTLSDN